MILAAVLDTSQQADIFFGSLGAAVLLITAAKALADKKYYLAALCVAIIACGLLARFLGH